MTTNRVGRIAGIACLVVVSCMAYALGSGKLAVVRVAGGSMTPALWPGDVCVVTQVAQPHVSDVVLIAPPGHTSRVLHRVRSLESSGVVTRGDANPVPDRELMPRSAVLGKVSLVIPVGRLVRKWQLVSRR